MDNDGHANNRPAISRGAPAVARIGQVGFRDDASGLQLQQIRYSFTRKEDRDGFVSETFAIKIHEYLEFTAGKRLGRARRAIATLLLSIGR